VSRRALDPGASRSGQAAFQRAAVHARAEGRLVQVGDGDLVDDALFGRAAHARLDGPIDLQLGVVHDRVRALLATLANAARVADRRGRREIHELGLGVRRRVLQRLDVQGGRMDRLRHGEKGGAELNKKQALQFAARSVSVTRTGEIDRELRPDR